MWYSHNDNDILDFAILWAPLGGPAPENVAAAFALDMSDYHHRLRTAARFQMETPSVDIYCPHIYAPNVIAALGQT